ncbi:hypothetical protein FKM82_013227 [Ascaphus truei]
MDVEAETLMIRQEYEQRFAQLKAEYEAEQKSRARLEEDISNLRNTYDLQLAFLEEDLKKKSAAEMYFALAPVSVAQKIPGTAAAVEPALVQSETTQPQVALHLHTVQRESLRADTAPATLLAAEETPRAVSPQQVLARLQMLEQQVVGGEQAKNKDLKEKQKRRKKYADERKKELVAALQNMDKDSGDQVLLNVYESIQDELLVKSKLLEKMQKKLKAADVEIEDLQSEFECERNDYLVTIRRQERDLLLLQQVQDQIQPLVRRDCNYSNLDKIRREAVWDEDSGSWKVPELVIHKTSLPTPPGLSQTKAKKILSAENEEHMMEEDRYKLMLSRSDSQNIASNYFKSKRASQILSADPMKSFALHNASPAHTAPLNTSPISTTSISSVSPILGMDMPQPRPFRLESLELTTPSAKSKRKKSKCLSGIEPL